MAVGIRTAAENTTLSQSHTTACRSSGYEGSSGVLLVPRKAPRNYMFLKDACFLMDQQCSQSGRAQPDTCLRTRCSARRRTRLARSSTLCLRSQYRSPSSSSSPHRHSHTSAPTFTANVRATANGEGCPPPFL